MRDQERTHEATERVGARLVLGWLAVGPSAAGEQAAGAPAGAASRAPRNAAEFDALFQQVKNWGRWGADDQLGSANLVTAAKRKQAPALVKNGLTVSLAHNPLTEKAEDRRQPVRAHDEPRLHHGHLPRVVPRLRAQPHRRAVPHPLQGPDLQRLRARRREHREGLRQARHRQPEARHRHARHADRHPAAEGRAYLEPGPPSIRKTWRRGRRRPGSRSGRATRFCSAPAAGRGATKLGPWAVGTKRRRVPRVDRAVAQGARCCVPRRRRRARTWCRRWSRASTSRSTRC